MCEVEHDLPEECNVRGDDRFIRENTDNQLVELPVTEFSLAMIKI